MTSPEPTNPNCTSGAVCTGGGAVTRLVAGPVKPAANAVMASLAAAPSTSRTLNRYCPAARLLTFYEQADPRKKPRDYSHRKSMYCRDIH